MSYLYKDTGIFVYAKNNRQNTIFKVQYQADHFLSIIQKIKVVES